MMGPVRHANARSRGSVTIVIVLVSAILSRGVAGVRDDENQRELLKFKHASRLRWRKEVDYCYWSGVACDISGALIQIDLSNRGLDGPLPIDWTQLADLRALRLNGNAFTGSLPGRWSRLTELEFLYLDGNQLTGGMRVEWCQGMTRLRHLYLHDNKLSGTLPSGCGSLQNLTVLNLEKNSLTGTLPEEWGHMDTLKHMYMGGNKLTGTLPESWSGYQNLQHMHLQGNSLSGTLPLSWMQSMDNLQTLYLSNNNLAGTLAPEIANLRQLTAMGLDGNIFQGKLPYQLSRLQNMRKLYLNGNRFSGSLPAAWGQLAYLSELHVDNNMLTGELPTRWSGMESLHYLYLRKNSITGTLPQTWADMSALLVADISGNSLRGELPGAWGQLAKLEFLSLGRNQLQGTLPSALGDLTSLEVMYLPENQFQGPLPEAWCQLRSLSHLVLRSNKLEGSVAAGDWTACMNEFATIAELSDNENMCADYNGNLEASPWAGGLRRCGMAEENVRIIPVQKLEDVPANSPIDGIEGEDHGAADPDENLILQHIGPAEAVSSTLASLPPPYKEEDERVVLRQEEEAGSKSPSRMLDAHKLAAVPLAPQAGDEDQGREGHAATSQPRLESPEEIPGPSADMPMDTNPANDGRHADNYTSIARLNSDGEDRAYNNILEEMGGEYLGSTTMGYLLVGCLVILLSVMVVACTLMILRVSGGRADSDLEHETAAPAAPDHSPGMTWHRLSVRQGGQSKGSGADLDLVNKILMGQASARGSGSLGSSSTESSGHTDRALINAPHPPSPFHHYQSPQASRAGCGAATAPSSGYNTWDGSGMDYACSPTASGIRRPSSVSVELQPNHDMSAPVVHPWAAAGFRRTPMTYQISGSPIYETEQVAHNYHPQGYHPTMQLTRTKSMEPLLGGTPPVGSMHRSARPTTPAGSSSSRKRREAADVDSSQKSSGSQRGSGVLFLDH